MDDSRYETVLDHHTINVLYAIPHSHTHTLKFNPLVEDFEEKETRTDKTQLAAACHNYGPLSVYLQSVCVHESVCVQSVCVTLALPHSSFIGLVRD